MTLPDFLRCDEYGEIFLAGHRITLYHLVKDYDDGCSAETLAAAYPTVTLALVHKVLGFYLENKAEVDNYVEKTRQEIDNQANAPQRGPSFIDLQNRLQMVR
jgi:uncharacterized protein (DUF433 family)